MEWDVFCPETWLVFLLKPSNERFETDCNERITRTIRDLFVFWFQRTMLLISLQLARKYFCVYFLAIMSLEPGFGEKRDRFLKTWETSCFNGNDTWREMTEPRLIDTIDGDSHLTDVWLIADRLDGWSERERELMKSSPFLCTPFDFFWSKDKTRVVIYAVQLLQTLLLLMWLHSGTTGAIWYGKL